MCVCVFTFCCIDNFTWISLHTKCSLLWSRGRKRKNYKISESIIVAKLSWKKNRYMYRYIVEIFYSFHQCQMHIICIHGLNYIFFLKLNFYTTFNGNICSIIFKCGVFILKSFVFYWKYQKRALLWNLHAVLRLIISRFCLNLLLMII